MEISSVEMDLFNSHWPCAVHPRFAARDEVSRYARR
jgi:hypothetical protein